MKRSSLMSLIITGLLGVGAVSAYAAGEEVQGIKVNKETGPAGDGSSVLMKGNPLPLRGQAIKVGEPLPSAMVTGAKDRKSTRLNSSHLGRSRMPSSA